MDDIELKIVKLMSRFTVRMINHIEKFEIEGMKIGSGMVLIDYIGLHKTCKMNEIADYLNVIPSTATKRVDKLVKLKLIERISGTGDRRTVSLKLSKKGEDLHEKFLNRRLQGMKMMFKSFSKEELIVFFNMYDQMIRNFDKEYPNFMRFFEKEKSDLV